MLTYLIRRLLYAPLIVLGVMLLTFVLFFVVQKPETMAKSVPTMSHSKAYKTPNTLPSESTPTLVITIRGLPNSFGFHTTHSWDQARSRGFKGAETGR